MHPVVYSAWDSHANFPTSDIYIDTIILNAPGAVARARGSEHNHQHCRWHHPYYASGISWTPWQNTSQLVLLDGNPTTAPWLALNGNWGPTWTIGVGQTPSLPSGAGTEPCAVKSTLLVAS